MARFLVLYRMPVKGLEAWMQLPEAERKAQESQMKADWDTWAAANATALKETAGAGKTKQVTAAGTADIKNDVMLYSLVEADSTEAAAKLFEGHPHLQIPEASIDVMPANVLPGMS